MCVREGGLMGPGGGRQGSAGTRGGGEQQAGERVRDYTRVALSSGW